MTTMSNDRSWTGMIRNTFRLRRRPASPYARPNTTKKEDETSWSISGLLNFVSGATQEQLPRIQCPSQTIDVEENTVGDASKTAGDPPAARVDATLEQPMTPRTPPRNSQTLDPTTGQSPALNAVSHTPLEKIHSFLERKKQDGTPLSEIEYAGIAAMLEKAREQTYEPEPFRFSSSPAKSIPPTPSRSPQPGLGPAETPTKKKLFSTSPSLPVFTNSTPSGSTPRKLVHNPNGEYRWMGAGSSRVSSSPRRRRTPSRNAPQNDTAKRRRTGEEASPESTLPTMKTAPAAMGSTPVVPSTPPRFQPLPRASVRLKTAPSVPSPLRNVVNGASPPGSPPSGSPQMRTRAATVLTEIIEKVTPPPKPDIANPYQTASPVKPTVPKTRKRLAERRAKEKERQAELEREKAKEKEEKEKTEAMPSPKTIIEATVPKGAKRSRPPSNIGKSPSKIGASESHLFGGVMDFESTGKFSANDDESMMEEVDEEMTPLPQKKSRFVTIEEIEDEDMGNGGIYTKPSEVIEPSEPTLPKPSVTVPSNAGPSTLNGSFASPTSPTNLFGGNSKPSIFGSKSSLPKEPSKLRSSFIAEEDEDESTKTTPPLSVPTPATSNATASAKQLSSDVLLDPKNIAMAVEASKLPVYVFKFTSPSTTLDFPEARKLAAATPASNIPAYNFWKTIPAASSSSSFPTATATTKANGGFNFPSSTPSSSAPKAFNWAAAGIKPAAAASGGDWTCNTCMLNNTASATEKCAVCEAPRPGATPIKEEIEPSPKTMPPPAPEVKAFDWAAAGLKKNSPEASSWKCDMCMLSNPSTATEKCSVCESPRP